MISSFPVIHDAMRAPSRSLSHRRIRVRLPRPHLTEQSLHSLHSLDVVLRTVLVLVVVVGSLHFGIGTHWRISRLGPVQSFRIAMLLNRLSGRPTLWGYIHSRVRWLNSAIPRSQHVWLQALHSDQSDQYDDMRCSVWNGGVNISFEAKASSSGGFLVVVFLVVFVVVVVVVEVALLK